MVMMKKGIIMYVIAIAAALGCAEGGGSLFSAKNVMTKKTNKVSKQHFNYHKSKHINEYESINPLNIPRGGDSGVWGMVKDSTNGLNSFMKGPKTDALLLLSTTALNTPICQFLKLSPILGFLALGLFFGPNGQGIIKDIHSTEILAELGIVFFLFEMGLHVDYKTLMSMKRDVFGIGFSQFSITTLLLATFCRTVLNTSLPAAIVIGWSLALSSSAFVLQLLKDKQQTNTQYGRSSFGILLFQDLMVVPLLVMTPILAGGGEGPAAAVSKALVQLTIALSGIGMFGKFLLNPVLDLVGGAGSQEAFIGVILATVLGMSFWTEGLGLSNTLGAFLAGMMIAETNYRHIVEVEAAPFRAILVGIFFFSVGFEIDIGILRSQPLLVGSIVAGLLTFKAAVATAIPRYLFGLPLSVSLRIGLVLSQGGEFAFVAFRTARSYKILDDAVTRLLLTCVSLTMALTPMLEDLGSKLQTKMEEPIDDEKKQR